MDSNLVESIFFIDIYWPDNYIIIMDTIKFEWDEIKNLSNQKKHQISFEEAQTVFLTWRLLSSMTLIIRWTRTDLLFLALAERQICLLYVIVIGNQTLQYELYQQGKLLQLNQNNITNYREVPL